MMYQRFLDFVQENDLFSRHNKVLLGVSGGIDSMVMVQLFLEAGLKPGIAHCNYRLRGEESEKDLLFVRQFAEKNDLPFHMREFDTDGYAREHKLSVQMAARKLRYQWFEQLLKEYRYDVVAIGHNKDDLAETFMINLSRGTGLKGLTGIKVKQGVFVRPLLFATREDIEKYSREKGVHYREDSSNLTTKYTRNKIRHQVIPVFRELNPRFLDVMVENIEHLRDAWALYQEALEHKKKELVRKEGADCYIRKDLKDDTTRQTLLYEILKDYHFTKETVRIIAGSMEGPPGKAFYSTTHKLIRDREWLIVTPLQPGEKERYYIEEHQQQVDEPVALRMRIIEDAGNYVIPGHANIASIDYDRLSFPLILRRWHAGDYFKPLGLGHYKKLSDFFVDHKYSLLDKERTWLLTSGEQIIWIVGDRLDDRFKVDARTKRILEVTRIPPA